MASTDSLIVLPPCRLLLDEVDAAERKASVMRLPASAFLPLKQRRDDQPLRTRLNCTDLHYILNDAPDLNFDTSKDDTNSFCSISSSGYDADSDRFYDDDLSCSAVSRTNSSTSGSDDLNLSIYSPLKALRDDKNSSVTSMTSSLESSKSGQSVVDMSSEESKAAAAEGTIVQKTKMPCTSKHCLKAQYLISLFDRRAAAPAPSRSSSTDSSTTASSSASCDSRSWVSAVEHGPDADKIHFYLPITFPVVEFHVPEKGAKSFGIALDDILQSGGACIPYPDVPALDHWRKKAKRGHTINLTVHWKGYSDEMVHPIQVKCDCGFDITRAQLALEIAQAQKSYFATYKIEESYKEPTDNTDTFHRSRFIVKDHHSLRLLALHSPDLKGNTWRANHALVDRETFMRANPKLKPKPKKPHPSDALAQGFIPLVWVEKSTCKCQLCRLTREARMVFDQGSQTFHKVQEKCIHSEHQNEVNCDRLQVACKR